jgi:very-short-patch-repair endonuclease
VFVLDPTLTALASHQWGLLSYEQLVSAGWTPHAIKHRTRAWRRVLKGIYLTDGRAVDENVLGMAAVLRWPTAVLSHETAARRRAWELLSQRPDWDKWLPNEPVGDARVQVTCATQLRAQPEFRLHRADPGDFSWVGPTRVTGEVRTLVDVARTAPLPLAVCLIDRVCHVDQMLFDDLVKELGRLDGQRGVLRAQRACRLAHSGSESILESLLRLLLALAGLPTPQVQIPVRHPGGTYYGDLGYRDRKLILEADGKDHHSDWQQVMQDISRQNLLVADGWMVLRFSWQQVLYQPELVIRSVAAALASRPAG